MNARLTRVPGQETPCWEWLGATNGNGYGALRYQGRVVKIHRLAYETFVGVIPGELVIDHLCRNRLCFNPDHLRVCTRSENVLAPGSESLAAAKAAQTHCIRGHPFDEANTYYYKQPTRKRACRACQRDRRRAAS